MSKLSKAFSKLSYRKKVFAGMFISAIFPILICLVGVLLSFRFSNEAKLKTQAENILGMVNEDLSETASTITNSLHTVAFAPATIRFLTESEDDNRTDVYRIMYNQAMKNDRHADYALYDLEGELKLYAGDNTEIKKNISANWGILYELSETPDNVSVRCGRLYTNSAKKLLLRMGQAVTDHSGNVVGYVIAQITERSFTEMFANINLEGLGAIAISDKFSETVYQSSEFDAGILASALKHFENNNLKSYVAENETERYYGLLNDKLGLIIVYKQLVEPYVVMNQTLFSYLTSALIVGLVISLVSSRWLSIMFYKPIRRMSDAMARVKQGDFEARVEVDSEDELGHLSQTFNDMSSKLTDNMEKLVNREKELADANIKMMQAQLNPHFIYNTLDTMKWIGKDNEIPEVSTLSSGLAAILRASISSGQTVSLKKEIELVENYAAIQQIRFADKFIFLTDIPDELLDCEIPKLILQPIVENAIIHGFENRDYGQVLVSARRDGDKLKLLVQDDGIGVSDEIITKLNNHEQLAKGTNIGFGNVDAIIRLHYGEQYGLKIAAGENGGTTVTYTLPYIDTAI